MLDRIFFYFGLFFALLPPPLTTQKIKNQNFEKLTKTPRDMIILQQFTKNYDHMLYCSLDMARDGCNYFSFWAIFCSFNPLTARKIKIKKKKMSGDIIILHKCTKNHDHMP